MGEGYRKLRGLDFGEIREPIMIEAIQFSSFGEFLNMGGYALNVWGVYAIFGFFVGVNLLGPLRRRKKILRDLRRRSKLENAES